MKILEYDGLNLHKYRDKYEKVVRAIRQDDFTLAQVRKLANVTHGHFYRARLDDANRLLFTLITYQGETYALMLEVIEQHDYAKSRFLRGANIDEQKFTEINPADVIQDAEPIRYINHNTATLRWLNKPISFTDAQESIFQSPLPMMIVGGAGSGKTALTLERLKKIHGEVLYVTHSAFLTKNAREQYYADGYSPVEQELQFLSYRELIESIQIPKGREANWRDFMGWVSPLLKTIQPIGAHQAFEEIRGVITAPAQGQLSLEAYLNLGVKQTIIAKELREKFYHIYTKYKAWLDSANLYDLNIIAHQWQDLAKPQYDAVVIDEVQDITTVQLSIILKLLKHPHQFLLCGDANQIVHPNFFSWSQLKSFFWHSEELADRQKMSILNANFRNAQETTHLANALLKIKHARFGSIDRESNYLVDPVGANHGEVSLIHDKDSRLQDINKKTSKSVSFAVLVMRDEEKAIARQIFSTPLLFSIHEAKGLEYKNIILFRFISNYRKEFDEIIDGVSHEALQQDSLEYKRAKDKNDKSLEIYKFYINALYVAFTRSVENLYIIESDTEHRMFNLLDLSDAEEKFSLEVQESSREDWQKEAQKLALMGKAEQAEFIHNEVLREAKPAWPVLDIPAVDELLKKIFVEKVPGDKPKQKLLEYAAFHHWGNLIFKLDNKANYIVGIPTHQLYASIGMKTIKPFEKHNYKEIIQQCNQYGLEHRLPMNITPLMAAVRMGNVNLVADLIDRGADIEALDEFGWNALHWAMLEAFSNDNYAKNTLPLIYEKIAPPWIDINNGDRLIRIDRRLTEYFLFQSFWVLEKIKNTDFGFSHQFDTLPNQSISAKFLIEVWQAIPQQTLSAERNRRDHLSNVLSRNEINRDYQYNRKLFTRISVGNYDLNPQLLIRKNNQEGQYWENINTARRFDWIDKISADY